jgi:hypothetical protein
MWKSPNVILSKASRMRGLPGSRIRMPSITCLERCRGRSATSRNTGHPSAGLKTALYTKGRSADRAGT